jgi:hypothetical protein
MDAGIHGSRVNLDYDKKSHTFFYKINE